MLNTNQIIDLEEKILERLQDDFEGILSKLNANGKLETLLELLDMSDLLKSDLCYVPYKSGKIYIIGQCDVQINHILGVVKSMGFDKNRFEFCTEYEKIKRFDFRKLYWKPENTLVLVGPMPHKTSGSGDYSSAISALEQEEGAPHVIRCEANGLKMTKSSIRCALESALELGYHAA